VDTAAAISHGSRVGDVFELVGKLIGHHGLPLWRWREPELGSRCRCHDSLRVTRMESLEMRAA